MIWIECLIALFIGIILTLIFAVGYHRHKPGAMVIYFFLIIFLVTWAGGVWIRPMGPLIFGISWMTFLFVGLLVALILTSIIPTNQPGEAVIDVNKKERDKERIHIFNMFTWFLVIILVIIIILNYV